MYIHIHAVEMNLISQKPTENVDKKLKEIAHTDVVQAKITCKDDEPMETAHIDEENKLHHDDGNLLKKDYLKTIYLIF